MNFKDLYLSYARDITDAPDVFHMALSYLIVSSVINKNVYMSFGHKKLYTNLYLLIGAPSSVYRKSWSQHMATNLINQIVPNFQIADTSSQASFVIEMADPERSPPECGLIAIDELGGFMGKIKGSQHFSGFMQALSSAYDGHMIHKKVGTTDKDKKTYLVAEPFLSLTAACSLDWLTSSTQTTDITGGFLARFLWIIVDGRVEAPRPKPGTEDLAKREELLTKLRWMQSLIAEAELDPEAETEWASWYTKFRSEHQGGQWDANYERLTVIAKKMAIINAVTRYEEMGYSPTLNKLSVNTGDIWAAVSFCEDTTQNFEKVVIGDSIMETLTKKVQQFIFKKQNATHSEILRGVTGINAWYLKNIITTLVESDLIVVINDSTDEWSENKHQTVYQPKF